MVFFPDNQKRANRLQQLVDSMANMQTDVIGFAKKMDDANTKYRPAIDGLLRANNLATIEDLIALTASRMTPQEKAVFEALINTARESKSGFDISYLIGSLLMVPEGVVLTGTQAISLANWGTRMIRLKNMSNFCEAAQEGTEAAAAAASKITAEAQDAEKSLQGAGDASEAGQEAAKAATMMGRIGTFFKVLGGVGLVITLIAGIIEIAQGAEQKKKLVDAIHGLQPARLTTSFYKQEGQNIVNQLESLDDYLDAMPGGGDPDPDFAARTAKRIILHIQTENKALDLGSLEDDLETQDRSSSLFYGGDDLSRDQVVAQAQAS